ncbi:FMN-binding negative transcriptional regulator [Pseudoruegeria sp. HB172150]|uniref:FMN-binding negative transcriptional regulator n=1 Tax=Pseudoruegeria sp. HB172150 TaxID=2721164 RepID=UPI00155733BD|nr:FMN-binding negative transcriptional regulator [Pseudoruegeria sp. HB172150]
MHPNPIFRKADDAQNIAFAHTRGFGILAVNGDPAPMLSHIPFVLNEDGSQAELHLVRSNPIATACRETLSAAIAVQGPDSYVSPDWYGIDDQVPTWNYVAVHLRGTLERRPQEELLPMLDRLSEQFEIQLAPKPVWQSAKMTEDVLQRLLRMIVPFTFRVSQIDGTWKLGQNKDEEVRLRAADAIARDGIGAELAALAAAMQSPPAE